MNLALNTLMIFVSFLVCEATLFCGTVYSDAMPPTGLMCDLMGFPEKTTIKSAQPPFSWILNDSNPETMQTGYQIVVSSSKELAEMGIGDLMDTGLVASDESTNIFYSGPPLASPKTYWWKVRTQNNRGELSPYSVLQSFTVGDLDSEHRTTTYPLEIHQDRPKKVIKNSKGNWFIEFDKAAFGTIKVSLKPKPKSYNLKIWLGEKKTRDDTVSTPEDGSILGGNFITHYSKELSIKAGQETAVIKLPERNRPKPDQLPANLKGVIPFRYCEVEGDVDFLTTDHVLRLSVSYPFNDGASFFKSSSPLLNQIWELCKYTIKTTSFAGIYVDGDRERIPYEGDAYINQLGHYCVDREFTLARHSQEFLIYNPTWPTEWIMYSVFMAYNDWMYTGDKRFVEKHYNELKSKTLLGLARQDGLISVINKKPSKEFLDSIHFKGESLKDLLDWPECERDGYDMRPVNTVVNAIHYKALILMSYMANGIGKNAEARELANRAERLKLTIQEKLFDKSQRLCVDGEGSKHARSGGRIGPHRISKRSRGLCKK